MDFTDLFHKVV